MTLAATILTPGFSDQAGDIGLRVAKPARLLTPILAEFFQLPVCQVSLQGIRREFIRGFALRTRRFIHRAQQIVRDMQVVLSCRGALGSSVPHPRQVGDPLSATCRRSEISSPAIRYFPLKLAPGQRLLARCEDLLADAAEFLAELRHHRFRCVAVLPGAIIGSFCHNFILAIFPRAQPC